MAEEMKLPSFIQVHGLQPVQSGKTKTGRDFTMQKASCQFLNEDGEHMQVGILRLPAADVGKLKPGIYRPVFGLRIDYQNNEVAPTLLSLDPMPALPPAGKASPAVKAQA